MSGDDFTPSTGQVRSHYVFNQYNKWDAERGLAFDRWLVVVKEEAWDECLDEIEQYEINTQQAREGNPYRRNSSVEWMPPNDPSTAGEW